MMTGDHQITENPGGKNI